MSQQLIKQAIDDVLSLTDAGTSPRSAIVKVAYTKSLLPDQITRVCQLYNRSTSLAGRIGDIDVSQKLASQIVIDPRQIIKDVSEKKLASSVQSQLAKQASLQTTVALLDKPDREVVRPSRQVKQASRPEPITTRSRYSGMYDGMTYKQAMVELDNLSAEHEACQRAGLAICRQIQSQRTLVKDQIRKLASRQQEGVDYLRDLEYSIKQAGQTAWLADGLVRYGVENLPANRRPGWYKEHHVPSVQRPDTQRTVQAVRKLASLYEMLETQGVTLAGQAASCRERLYILRQNLTEYGVKNSSFVPAGLDHGVAQQELVQKVANMFGSLLGTQINALKSKAVTPQVDPKEREFRLKLNNPQHVANLGAIRTRTALQELMTDDPVLSAANPEDVLTAYNELATYAPQALQSAAVMRAVLRQYLQNNASSFDLAEVRKLERDDQGR